MAAPTQLFGRAIDARQLDMTVAEFQAPLLAFKRTGLLTQKGRTHLMRILVYLYGCVEDASRSGVLPEDLQNILPSGGTTIKGEILGHWSNDLHVKSWQASQVYTPVVACSSEVCMKTWSAQLCWVCL